jgi:N-acetylglucosaminyldiphosphoundecaprenol N-acetyl-beta-D-mannosaminyltransferase
VQSLSVKSLNERLFQFVRDQDHHLILNVNAYCLNLTFQHPWLRDFLNSAELVFCDGAGILIGAQILGFPAPIRITYADWIWQLAEFAEQRGLSFFFLGARPGIAEKAADYLKERFPDLHVVGTHHGFFDKTQGCPDNEAVIERINSLKPDILIIGFGMPTQERWLMENWPRINANIALTGGAVFDYTSGDLQRAPKWMTDNGLEWLGRLLIEPRRLWRRYLIGNPLFLWRVIQQRFGLLQFD